MASKKLTQETAFTSANRTKDILVHLVDTADNAQDPSGSSFKGTLEDVQGWKEYIATVSQVGTGAPTANVLKNELIGLPVWAYVSAGVYTLTFTAAFPTGKTAVWVTGTSASAFYNYTLTSANQITFRTQLTTGPNNGLMDGTSINIKVFR